MKSVMTFGIAWPTKNLSRLVQWPETAGSQLACIGWHAKIAAIVKEKNQHSTSTATAPNAIRRGLTGPNIR